MQYLLPTCITARCWGNLASLRRCRNRTPWKTWAVVRPCTPIEIAICHRSSGRRDGALYVIPTNSNSSLTTNLDFALITSLHLSPSIKPSRVQGEHHVLLYPSRMGLPNQGEWIWYNKGRTIDWRRDSITLDYLDAVAEYFDPVDMSSTLPWIPVDILHPARDRWELDG